MLKLNLGSGNYEMVGYDNIDRKKGSEVYPLAYADNSVDEIRASHILEHFGFVEAKAVLIDWVNKLKPGGILKIAVPDFEKIAKKYFINNESNFAAYLMGGQLDENDYHKSCFDKKILKSAMESIGLTAIIEWRSEIADCANCDISLNLQGTKPSR
jgi:predicted SAM-dependent methyltransferase